MTVEEVMEMFGISADLDRATRERTAKWSAEDDDVNADELAHYFQVAWGYFKRAWNVRYYCIFLKLKGDILTLPWEENGVVNEDRKWPGGEIPYTFWNNNFGKRPNYVFSGLCEAAV